MFDETFAEALVHRPAPVAARLRAGLTNRAWSGHKILGLRLRPFSYWHAFCLDSIKSPFAGHRPDGAPDIGDVVLGIRACRAWYPHFPNFEGLGFRMLRRRARLAHALGEKETPHSLRDAPAIIAFFNYVSDYSSVPVYGESEGGDNEKAKTPWYLFAVLLRVRLHKELGILPPLTLAQAWNTPIGYGGWINAAMIEATGGKIDILTPELRQAFSEIGVKV